jgi:predicted transcriptional regulator
MKRTTVKLPDELDARLRHEAQRRGVSISELTREAIEEKLGKRRLLSVGAGRSGGGNIAERIEELLAEDVEAGKYPPPFRT